LRRSSIGEILSSAQRMRALVDLLSRGGVAALPTETFYGLGADPLAEPAVRRVFAAKGRAEEKALPVLFASPDQLEALGVAAPAALLERLLSIWPAPLTVVLPLFRPIPASRGRLDLALRLPASEPLRRLLSSTGPLTGTSANLSGLPPTEDPDVVERLFDRTIDFLVDGGRTPGGRPSTLVDATVDPPAVLRAGAYPWPP
jgi:L-threonylcarbamoyladenylate synthase